MQRKKKNLHDDIKAKNVIILLPYYEPNISSTHAFFFPIDPALERLPVSDRVNLEHCDTLALKYCHPKTLAGENALCFHD